MFRWKGLQRTFGLIGTVFQAKHFSTSGKMKLSAICAIATLLIFVTVFSFNVEVPHVSADALTTSVYVLNTPPQWTVDAEELVASATTTPTNAGGIVTWIATADDSNLDAYYLLICKTSATPTANAGAAPSCGGGISNRWAVSTSTVSGRQASISTTTKETFPFNAERNDWYAWICDGNASLAQCNATYKQTNGDFTKASPFFVNHPPVFYSITNTSPVIPGGTITWTAGAYDNDVIRGSNDTVQLFVCKANDFTGTACGAGGTWATSTLVTTNPATTTTIAIPTQDKNYAAYVYVSDYLNSVATSTLQASSSQFTVSNVAPSVSSSSITIVDPVHSSSTIVLANPNATSGPYWVQFQVTDNNSCLNSTSGQEIASIETAVYRSGVASTSCHLNTSSDYNANNCYPSASPLTDFRCTQDAGSCSGSSDTTSTFTCTFSLWYNTDPTDANTPWTSENWLSTVRATDDNGLQSSITETNGGGKDVTSFLAFDVVETSIGFGGLQPGQQLDPFNTSTSTTLKALGNVGIDETLYGDTMCTTWSSPDSCDNNGIDPTNDIPITNQKVATSTIAYGATDTFTLAGSTTPVLVGLHVLKTTATSTPQSKLTLWAIRIPATITIAGSYTGQDTITAITASSSQW